MVGNISLRMIFQPGTYPDSTREMWVSTTLGRGDLVIGQFKPYRGMEEL